MNHDTLIRHMSRHTKMMIDDLGVREARGLLRRCVVFWRDRYGKDVAKEMGLIIAKQLKERADDSA